MSDKSYVISGGWNRDIIAVFSERALADRFVEATALGPVGFQGQQYKITEVPRDPFLGPLVSGMKPWQVIYDDPLALAVRIDNDPSDTTIWAPDPDSARMIARLRPDRTEPA